MKSDKDGFVIYEVPFAGKKIQLTPEHLIGSYIYDRIEDIKAERHVDDLRLVLSVPSYFTEEQISAMMDKAQKMKNEDSLAGMYALFLAPQLTGGGKIIVDMLVLMVLYLGQYAPGI